MPRLTNPGAILTGPGKPISTDTDKLVLGGLAGGIGEGSYIPPGETTPRAGYPALPCRACGGTGSGTASDAAQVILTVGTPTANPAWVGFTPDFNTLAEAVAEAGVLMSPDGGGNPGRIVKIMVVGPTVETAVPIEIPVDGLIIEGSPQMTNAAVTWGTDDPLIDLNGHDGLVFRDLTLTWDGVLPPPGTFDRVFFANNSSNRVDNLTIENCHGSGSAQGFLSNVTLGSLSHGGFRSARISGNIATELLEYGILSGCILSEPFSASLISENYFVCAGSPALLIPAVTLLDASLGGVHASNTTTIRDNVLASFYGGISTLGMGSTAGTLDVHSNFIFGTQTYGIFIEGNANRVVGNTLLGVFTDVGTKDGLYVDGDGNVVDSNYVTLDTPGSGDRAIHIGNTGVNNICSQNDVTEDDIGYILDEGSLSVVTGNKALILISEGLNSSVGRNLVRNLFIQGQETAVQGNNVALNLSVENDRCSVTGNRVTGNLVTTGTATRCTLGDNYVGGSLTIPVDSTRHTISGNQVEGNLTVAAIGQDISGNIVRGETGLLVVSDECTVTGNNVLNTIQIDGNVCTVNGNRTDSFLLGIGQELTIGGNIVGAELQVAGSNSTVIGNRVRGAGGSGDIVLLIGVSGCNVIGNNVAGNIIELTPGANVAVGNTALGGSVFGIPIGGPWTNAVDNNI